MGIINHAELKRGVYDERLWLVKTKKKARKEKEKIEVSALFVATGNLNRPVYERTNIWGQISNALLL